MRLCTRLLYGTFLTTLICFTVLANSVAVFAAEGESEKGCSIREDGLKCIQFTIPEVDTWFDLTSEGKGLPGVINGFIKLAFSISSVLLVLYIAWFGTAYIYQQMKLDVFQAGKAKNNMIGAVYGISVLLCSYIILDFFVPSLLSGQNILEKPIAIKTGQPGADKVLQLPIYPCRNEGDLVSIILRENYAKAFFVPEPGYGTEKLFPGIESLHVHMRVDHDRPIRVGKDCEKVLEKDDYTLGIKILYASPAAVPAFFDFNETKEFGEGECGKGNCKFITSKGLWKHTDYRGTINVPAPSISKNIFAVFLVTFTDEGEKKTYRSRSHSIPLEAYRYFTYGRTKTRGSGTSAREKISIVNITRPEFRITRRFEGPGVCDEWFFSVGKEDQTGCDTNFSTAEELIEAVARTNTDECELSVVHDEEGLAAGTKGFFKCLFNISD